MGHPLTPSAAHVLALGFGGDSTLAREHAARALASASIDVDDRAAILAATAFVDYTDARFADALVSARRAVALARGAGAPARLLSASAHALASANELAADPSSPGLGDALALLGAIHEMHPEVRWLAAAVLVESAFANGQIAVAGEVLVLRDTLERPPFALVFAGLQSVRAAIYGGNLEVARSECEAILSGDGSSTAAVALAHAFEALVAAYRGDVGDVERSLAAVRTRVRQPTRWVDGGAHLVGGYALAALDRMVDARPWILAGGGGPDLHLAQVVDRALGFEILVAAAISEGDLAGAEAWMRRARDLYAAPAAVLAVEQAEARLALARGDADASQVRAAVASERAQASGRLLEANAAMLVRARAMVAAGESGPAIDQLTLAAHGAEVVGAIALRQRAAGELRRLGRRLEPRRGAGTQALSRRELEVAELAAEGFTSPQIAQSLFISERTVQVHLRRAMRALGVSGRAGLPAALGTVPDGDAEARPLTPRQHEVALHVRAGLSNAEIAAALGISVKTVEKHVAMIFDRWGVRSRTGIARLAAFVPAQ